jgi:hypothetical protein
MSLAEAPVPGIAEERWPNSEWMGFDRLSTTEYLVLICIAPGVLGVPTRRRGLSAVPVTPMSVLRAE